MSAIDALATLITANTDALKAQLDANHTTVISEFNDLKAAVAAGQPPDFTALQAAIDAQTAVIGTAPAAQPITG